MNNFTFLTDEQIFGENQLNILKKYGTRCAITDFAILLGGSVSTAICTNEGNTRKDRTSWWWSKTPCANLACIVNGMGNKTAHSVKIRRVGARPVLPYSSIKNECITMLSGITMLKGRRVINQIKYGEYPQMVVSEKFSETLETAFANMSCLDNGMKATGKKYTTDSTKCAKADISFKSRTHVEYEYNGRKYIRFVGDSNCDGEVLSDGRTVQ